MNSLLTRRLLLPMHERLMRRPSLAMYRQLCDSQFFSPEQVRERQLAKLRQLVGVFLRQTGYARLAGVEADWLPESLDDLRRLPLLDKETLRAGREELVNRLVPGGPIRHSTGGSTGDPLTFYVDRRRQAADKAARMLTHAWWSIRPGDREAYIWGSPIELSRADRTKRLRDRLLNERLFSAYELVPELIHDFIRRLARFKPVCLYGYPGSIALMCQLAQQAGIDLSELPMRVVFSTAEVLYDHQRKTISAAFGGAPVVDNYGSREGGFISHQCPAGRMHIIAENIIIEVLDEQGQPAATGQDGQIVITHLDNFAMPFIRYQTGDVGRLADGVCPCGRGWPLMEVVKGRCNDHLLTPDGRAIHDSAFNYALRDISNLRQYQIVQEDLQTIRLLLVMDGQLPPEARLRIERDFRRRMNAPVTVAVEQVSEIPLSPSGKFRYVISKVQKPQPTHS